MQLQFLIIELSDFIKWIRLSVFSAYTSYTCPKWFVMFEIDYKCHLDVHI